MDIARVDGTLEFTLGSTTSHSTGNQRTAADLNETPFTIKEEHLARMRALSRTGIPSNILFHFQSLFIA